MTRNNNTLTLTKKILVFILSVLMCLSLFFAAACKKDDNSSSSNPEFSYKDQTDCEIDNPDFTYGTANMSYADYPKTSISGWSISKTATSNSGVIDVSNKGWEKLLSNLAKDNGILNYVRNNNGNFTDADIKAEMIEKYPDTYDNDQKKPTTSQIKKYIAEKYFIIPETPEQGINYPFTNPLKHANATDNKIYMLNNYLTGDLGYGCAQSLTSSKTITLVAGEYAKVSVYVKTANLNLDNTLSGYGKEVGANIRLKNSFNSDSQSDFGIFNITNSDWQEYHFYVKADSVFETKFSLVLGLGYGDYAAEGTAYFDDITVELLDKEEYATEIAKETSSIKTYNLEYKEKDNENVQIEASNYSANYHVYDMSLDLSDIDNPDSTNFTEVISYSNQTNYYSFTEYKGGTHNGNPNDTDNNVYSIDLDSAEFVDVPYGIDEGLKVELKKPASITVKLDNEGANFSLSGESYASITFFVKNNLNKLYAKDIVINVQDISNGTTIERPAVATISELSNEWVKYTVFVRNNFDKDKFATSREFYLDIVIGPDTYQEEIDKYALGTVYFSSPIVAMGKTYQYEDEVNKIETPNYNFYNLFSSTANGDVALYAGYDSDYSESTADATTFSIPVSLSDLGTIMTRPATPKNYTGIQSNHYYITGDADDSVIVNENKNSGLINTKYKNNYSAGIVNALNYDDEEHIQPLMITPYNDSSENKNYSYGFISEKYTILPGSYAKISVDLKVVDATAYIYLVDVSKKQKDVLKFDEFTVNTASGKFNNNNQTIAEKSLFFTVDPTTMNGQDWITVEFYIATGYNQKDFRIELWNGSRSDSAPLTSDGYVFVKSVDVVLESAFVEPTRWQDALSGTDTPLSNKINDFTDGKLLTHLRELSKIEKKYNADENKQGANVVYQPKYIWAQTDTMIYAIYNTIDPIYENPYDYEPIEDEKEDDSLINRDPATFWMSFSTILLGVALVVALTMLIIKNIRRKRKASVSDAKSHYTVRSRVKKPSKTAQKPKNEQLDDSFEPIMEPIENEQTDSEQSLDDYVYGDVQDFGEDSKKEDSENE